MENLDKDLFSIQEARTLARQGKQAAVEIATYNESQIDKILRSMVNKALDNAVELAAMAVNDTGFGNVKDKTVKNFMASQMVYNYIKDMKTIGVLSNDPIKKITEIAEPVGLLMGIVPSTNPTSTAIYNSMIAIKARNAIVFSPHPSAVKCTKRAADLMAEAAVEAGAPRNVIQCISTPSIESTNELMKADEISMIIATGGPGMVKAAYSAGKPALGVGAGNSPSYIEQTANICQSVTDIIESKTFDNGTICASEQSVVVDECISEKVIQEFKKQGGYFMTPEETNKVCALLFKKGTAMNPKFVGRSAKVIANAAGFNIPEGTKVLIGRQEGVGEDYPLSYEKLTTVLAFYIVKDCNEACDLSFKLLQNGIGHTMNVHTENPQVAKAFSIKPASRILINVGGSQGGAGMCTGLAPAFTLGCGTCGGSATSENVSPLQLINVKKMAYGICTVDDVIRANPRLSGLREDAKAAGQNCGIKSEPVKDMGQDQGISDDQLRKIVKDIVGSFNKCNG